MASRASGGKARLSLRGGRSGPLQPFRSMRPSQRCDKPRLWIESGLVVQLYQQPYKSSVMLRVIKSVLRFIKYTLSIIGVLYFAFLNSPYNLNYGEHGREFFNDDSIFFGMMMSFLFLLMHVFSSLLSKYVLKKGIVERGDILFGLCFLLLTCYWIYFLNSDAAMHEHQ